MLSRGIHVNGLNDRLTLSDRFDIQAHGMKEILTECLEGKILSRVEVLSLLPIQGDEFESLLDAAAVLRDRSKGKIVTFSPKVFTSPLFG